MPLNKELRKIMVIGSGPIVIGQAAEFDYAGSQACRALREEGLEVVLVNSNPATIMTDADMADRTYIEPLTRVTVAAILRQERPDGLLATLGGQVGLNLAVELGEAGILSEMNVALLGTPLAAIRQAEDRESFKVLMESIGEPVPESRVVSSLAAAEDFVCTVGYPVIVRPAYTLGGTGGGIVRSGAELRDVVTRGLKMSRIGQVLIERSVAGWKEIEFEVMRDGRDNCVVVCGMENFDPIGVHTGDSIVVAPCQTLSERAEGMLRAAALKIIRALGIEGGCNVQFALEPAGGRYYVIEVNPRVSRSSALASKAAGYPIARVASKIAVGMSLDEIPGPAGGRTAADAPVLDYVVTKIPRWPFDKFAAADRTLTTQMKSTGEVMAIDRTFEGSLLKAVRSLETGDDGLGTGEFRALSGAALRTRVETPDDRRLFAVAAALRRGMTPEEINRISGIDSFFLRKIQGIVAMEGQIAAAAGNEPPAALLRRAKECGFSDRQIARLLARSEAEIRDRRRREGIIPAYRSVPVYAAGAAAAPYFYSSYGPTDAAPVSERKKVIVIGAGPIRIGQGIEFDYCTVHAVRALQECGVEAIIVNNNPETVSTDFNISDRLYFEPLGAEDVLNLVEKEKPDGVIVQFGGQTAINLAGPLAAAGVPVLGTPVASIDAAEDRDKFDRLLTGLGIAKPAGRAVTGPAAGLAVASAVGYPVVVRPSYVLGGRAMEIVYGEGELAEYLATAVKITPDHPVLVDKYLAGREIEVDAVADGETVLIPGIMEHVERAGIHSGDSTAVYPPRDLPAGIKARIVTATADIAKALHCRGLLNIQYVVYAGELYVLEVNPRASRTVPYLSKITGIPLVALATQVILGRSLRSLGWPDGLWSEGKFTAVKMPVFSWAKLGRVDTSLGPEMKSTGEVMGLNGSFAGALYKAFLAAGFNIPAGGEVLLTIADKDKAEAVPIARRFARLGFRLHATAGTAAALAAAGIPVNKVNKIREGSPQIIDLIRSGSLALVINTMTRGKVPERDGFRIRRAAVEYAVPCLTSLDTAGAILAALAEKKDKTAAEVKALQDYLDRQEE
ncbi:MAG: carbamoyl-phosphate synthase large subunit [bacterium]